MVSSKYSVKLFQIFVCTTCFRSVRAESGAKFTQMDYNSLEKFREISTDLLSDQAEYVRSNEFLIRWIRAKKYDLGAARIMLKQALEWRKENGIDTILQEDFSKFAKKYPYWVDGVDYQKRPISTLPMAQWDLRRAVLGGELNLITRYLDQMLEKVTTKALELLPNSTNDIPLQVIIVDVNGFNLRQHVCVSCLPIYFSFITHHENYYPETTGQMFIINTPRMFSTLLDIVRPILSSSTRRNVSVFGLNKAEWRKAILKVVPADQITSQFGGNKVR